MKRFKLTYRIELIECPGFKFEFAKVWEESAISGATLKGCKFRDAFNSKYGDGSCTLLVIEEL